MSGSSFIEVTKANGIWTIAPDYALLAEAISITQTQVLVVFDPITGFFNTVNASQLIAMGQNTYRIVTAAGDVSIQSADMVILMNKSVGAATNINLPLSSDRGGVPVTCKDFKGDSNINNITFVPSIGETIDGFSAADAITNGIALIDIAYGKKTLFPLTSGGWYL